MEVPPSPKVQLQEVGVFVLESVNETLFPWHKVVGVPPKLATGAKPAAG